MNKYYFFVDKEQVPEEADKNGRLFTTITIYKKELLEEKNKNTSADRKGHYKETNMQGISSKSLIYPKQIHEKDLTAHNAQVFLRLDGKDIKINIANYRVEEINNKYNIYLVFTLDQAKNNI